MTVDPVLGRRLPVRELQKAVRWAMEREGLPKGTLVIRVTDDRTIQDLNRRYLGHDYPTDVLTFNYTFGEMPRSGVLGEVVISWETACRQAEEYGHDSITEVLLLAIHGVLHLAGWDDATEEQRTAMQERAEDLLAALRRR